MTTDFHHGTRYRQEPTKILSPVLTDSAFTVVVGTAPVHLLPDGWEGRVNKPLLALTYPDAVLQAGYSDDWESWTICEQIYTSYVLYETGNLCLINVFDPDEHKTAVVDEAVSFNSKDELQLANPGLVAAPVVTSADGQTTYVEGDDYTVSRPLGKVFRVPADEGGAIAEEASVLVSYEYGDPTLVTTADIIGGIDISTGAATGMELIDEVFPRYRKVSAIGVAPGWSHDSEVAAILTAKMENIDGVFAGVAVIDCPADTVTQYQDVPQWKNLNNITDESQALCWPKVRLGDKTYWMSSHWAAAAAATDREWKGVPYKSPSNVDLNIDALEAGGEEITLNKVQADYLNSQGVVTGLNWIGGWKLWGNCTAAYPAVTDPKDMWIPIKRMTLWYGARLVLTWFQRVDWPIVRRLIKSIVDSENINLNGMTAEEIILGGEIMFLEEDNPITDLLNGSVKFRVMWTPPPPAQDIQFILEYDVDNLRSLFEGMGAA